MEQQHLVSPLLLSFLTAGEADSFAAGRGPVVPHPRQRLYQMAAADFQRKLDEACKRRRDVLGSGPRLLGSSVCSALLCRKVTTSRMELASEPGAFAVVHGFFFASFTEPGRWRGTILWSLKFCKLAFHALRKVIADAALTGGRSESHYPYGTYP